MVSLTSVRYFITILPHSSTVVIRRQQKQDIEGKSNAYIGDLEKGWNNTSGV